MLRHKHPLAQAIGHRDKLLSPAMDGGFLQDHVDIQRDQQESRHVFVSA